MGERSTRKQTQMERVPHYSLLPIHYSLPSFQAKFPAFPTMFTFLYTQNNSVLA